MVFKLPRMDGARRQRPGLPDRPGDFRERIGDEFSANRIGGMSDGKPEDLNAQSGLRKNVPEGFDLSGCRGRGASAPGHGVRFDEPENPMPVGGLSRDQRSPEQGRNRRGKAGQVPHDPARDQLREMGQATRIEERVYDLPVRGIPTDEDEPASRHVRNSCRPAFGFAMQPALKRPWPGAKAWTARELRRHVLRRHRLKRPAHSDRPSRQG